MHTQGHFNSSHRPRNNRHRVSGNHSHFRQNFKAEFMGLCSLRPDLARYSCDVCLLLCFYRLRNKLINIFLDWSTHFLKDHMLYYLYPFIFIALTVGLIVLCMFQHLAYLSNADPTHQDGDIYLNLSTNTPLFILNLIEFVWGLQFLKDSCKFTAI